MNRFPAWGWAVVTIGAVAADLLLGAGGRAGRGLSRAVYWPVVSIALATTMFSYLEQYRHPTRKLSLINLGAVVLLLFLTLPLWHFGAMLPDTPGGPMVFLWWVNPLVLVLAAGMYYFLHVATRHLRPQTTAEEDKPERLTV